MGKVTFKDPVDTISGRISKNRPTIFNLGHKGVRRGNQWTSWLGNPRDYDEHPKSALETKSQERFKAVRLAVKAIKTDPDELAEAYEAYAAVRDNYKSFTSYLWKTECTEWNTQHAGGGGGPVEE